MTTHKVLITVAVNVLLAVAAHAQPDLDVTFISRTPRYRRYVVVHARGLPQQLAAGTENDQHWPVPGEVVTYTAHVINKGDRPADTFAYRWQLDGAIVSEGKWPALPAGDEASFTFRMEWSDKVQSIEFDVDPNDAISESAEKNNSLAIGTHDLTILYYVERGLYDIFNANVNFTGSRSFEDWIQAHFSQMNARFGQAVYPVSPNGIRDRVRIDKFVVAEDVDGAGSPMALDPDTQFLDGRWQGSDGDPTNVRGQGGAWSDYAKAYIGRIDWGLIHEVSHQVGDIDCYRMNIRNNEPASPNGGVSVKDARGRVIPYSALPFPVFENPGIMGGCETAPYRSTTYFESHTAGGMNAHALRRRGYYGEYLFDTPEMNSIRIVNSETGSPIADARVALYQKDYNTEDIDDVPEIAGKTNGSGVTSLPNRPVIAIATATGHTLTANPFGQINPTGQNGTMLVVVRDKSGAESVGFLRLHDLNLAYWSGRAKAATHDVRVRPLPVNAPLPNQPPHLKEIGAQTVAEGMTLGFEIGGVDPEGDAVTYSVKNLPAGATFSDLQFKWRPNFDQAGFHSVTFIITDERGQTDSETVLIAVTNVNQAPVARVGIDQVAGTRATVTLDGSASSDADLDALACTWTQTSGPAVTLSNATSTTPSFAAPQVTRVTTLAFSLTISDGILTSAPATATVTIHPNLTASGNAQAGGQNVPVRWRQACSAGNRMLLVTTAEWRVDDNSQIGAITYAGVPLTKLTHRFNLQAGPLVSIWYLIDPPSGDHEIRASLGNTFASFGSSCWYDVMQSAPVKVNTATGVSLAPSITVPSEAGDMVVDALATFGENPPVSANAGQFVLANVTKGQSRAGHSARPAGAGSTATSWTIASGDGRWSMIGVALTPAR